MKKISTFIIVVIIIYFLFFSMVNFIFQGQIKRFIGKRLFLSLQSFRTNLLNSISLKDLSFKEFLKISHAKFKFRPLSLFKSRIKGKIELKDLNFSSGGFKIKDDVLVDFSLNLQLLKVLEIEETSLYSKTLTLRMKGELEPIFKPKNAFLKTRISSFSYLDFDFKDLISDLKLSEEEFSGKFSVESLNYNKFSLNNISSEIIFQNKKIRLESLKADIFKGRVDGGIEISFLPSISYNLNLEVSDLNLKEITQKFAPQDCRAKGIISGKLNMRTEGRDLKRLEGKFYSQRSGAINMKAIRKLLPQLTAKINKKIFKKGIFFYENLDGKISLLRDDIIVELILESKEVRLKFDIKIEPEVLGSFLIRR